MKRTPLAKLTIATFALSGLVWTGCGLNRANDEAANLAPVGENADAVAAESPAPAVESRQAELAAREEAVAQLERELDRRLQDLEQRVEQTEIPRTQPVQPPAPAELPPAPFPRRLEPTPQPASRVVELTLPASTPLQAELIESLSSETQLPGDPVQALVTADVVQDGVVAIPRGSLLRGNVEEAVAQKKIGGQARVAVSFNRLQLASGEEIPVTAYFASEGKNQKKKDAATIGGAAAGGAVLGRVLSKNDRTKGTLIGAVLGGAIGTAVATKNNGDPVMLQAGTVIELFLEAPVSIAVETAPAVSTVASNR